MAIVYKPQFTIIITAKNVTDLLQVVSFIRFQFVNFNKLQQAC